MNRLAGIVAVLLLISCAGKKKSFNQFVSIEKTPCYGTCPQFTMKILSNGQMTYHGERFVTKTGNFSAMYPKSSTDSLFKVFKKARLSQFDSVYGSEYSDLPSVILTYSNGRKTYKSVIQGKHPEQLTQLIKLLDSIEEKTIWKNDNLQ